MRTFYSALGVTASTSEYDVRRAWRRLAAAHHPDRHAQDPELAAQLTSKLAELNGAYAVLGDRKAREAYDRALALTTDPCRPCRGSGVMKKQRGFSSVALGACPTCGGCGRTERERR